MPFLLPSIGEVTDIQDPKGLGQNREPCYNLGNFHDNCRYYKCEAYVMSGTIPYHGWAHYLPLESFCLSSISFRLSPGTNNQEQDFRDE